MSRLRSWIQAGPPFATFSLRKVLSGYTGQCVNVRRSSENTSMDIGFTCFGSTRALSTSQLLTFVGAGEWVL